MCIAPAILLRLVRVMHLHRIAKSLQLISHRDNQWKKQLKRTEMWTRDTPLVLVSIAACVPYVVATIVLYFEDERLGHNCHNCEIGVSVVRVSSILGFCFMVACLTAMWCTRDIEDSLFLRQEIKHGVIMWVVLIVLAGSFNLIPALRELQDGGHVTPGWWYLAGAVSFFTIMVTLPTLGTWSIGPYKSHAREHGFLPRLGRTASMSHASARCLDISDVRMSVGDADAFDDLERSRSLERPDNMDEWELIDVLQEDDSMEAFMAHLASEFSVESIKFWIHTGEFADSVARDAQAVTSRGSRRPDGGRESTAHDDETDLKQHLAVRAQWIVETYLTDTAPLMVNVSFDQRQAVQDKLQRGDVTGTLFDECRREIYLLMERDSFPRFRRGRRFAALKAERAGSARHPGKGTGAGACWKLGCCHRSSGGGGDSRGTRRTSTQSHTRAMRAGRGKKQTRKGGGRDSLGDQELVSV